MITDFTTLYSTSDLRNITFNGLNSLRDLNLLICKDSKTDDVTARTPYEEVPYSNGVIDFSRAAGELYYEARSLVYKFKTAADTASALKAIIENTAEWAYSDGQNVIQDSSYGGKKFTRVRCESIVTENIDIPGMNAAYITATFRAYPKMSN